MGYINAESIDSEFEPEVQNFFEMLSDDWVIPVEIWLFNREKVQVPLTRLSVGLDYTLPSGTAKNCLPVIRRQFAILTLAISKDVAIALRRAWSGFEGLLEPLVLV